MSARRLYLRYRHLYQTKRWQRIRRQVFDRAGYRCQTCGMAGRLECDHVRTMAELVAELLDGAIETLDVATLETLFFDMKNLQALCRSCHIKKSRRERGGPSADRLAWRHWMGRG